MTFFIILLSFEKKNEKIKCFLFIFVIQFFKVFKNKFLQNFQISQGIFLKVWDNGLKKRKKR